MPTKPIFNFTENEMRKPKPFGLFVKMPNHVKNIISLFLPIEDIQNLKSASEDDEFLQIHSLLHEREQNQLLFRFTSDMGRVFTRSQLLQMGIRYEDCYKICTELYKMQQLASRVPNVITTERSGVQASTRDDPTQDIDRTLDGIPGTFWSSDGSNDQEKVDWLLFDLGTVAVISRISIAAFKATFHLNHPVYGFKKCWIELGFDKEEFHYKTKEFVCLNTDELQSFTQENLDHSLPAARFIKFWMQGCHQKQRIDDKWYFAINRFKVEGIPLECFPDPVPKIREVAGNLKSKTREWLGVSKSYQQYILTNLREE